MSPAPGTKLGPYEIVSPLGAGGMGEVYRARDTRLGRDVAVKILPKELSTDAVRKQRFEREARIISSLNHPNICTLHDIGSQDGMDYLVMECVEGETLAKRLEKGPLPLEQVLKYGAQIADALDKAHRSGVVHRDLKPGNIMLTPTGAKLLDFGLAKPAAPVLTGVTLTAMTPRSPMTEEGTIVGTFHYMSPEQVEGKELDGRSDLFSLGAVLYEMLTGQRAFEGKSQLSVASAILEKEPAAISEIKPMTPPALDQAIRRCFAKDPEERWQAARDLAGELKWISEGGSQVGVSAVRSSRRRWREIALVGLVGTLAIATAVLGYAYLHRETTQGAPMRASIMPPANAAFGLGYALSPDGTRVVFAAQTAEGKSGLWVRGLDSSTAQELGGTANGFFPFWSPDGQWVGFFANEKLKKIPVSGGAVQEICDAPLGRGGTWNAQGTIVFAPGIVETLQKVAAGGGVPMPVTQMDESTGERTHRWPNFLPDGEHFLYLARQTSPTQPAAVYVGSLEGNFRKKVLDGTSEAQYVEPGYLLFVRNKTLFAQRFDTRKLSVEGDVIPIATDVLTHPGSLWAGATASQTGQLLYTSTGYDSDTELLVTDRTGNSLSSFTLEGTNLRLSPDGKRIAEAFLPSVTTERGGIWIYELTSELKTRLVFTEAYYISPVWSPNGTQLAFASTKTGPYNMYVKTVNGGADEMAIHASPEDERPTSWSPDGKYLVYDRRSTARRGIAEIVVLPMNGEEKSYSLLNASYLNWGGQVSPDGRWVAFASNQSGKTEICVSTFPQAKGIWQVSATGGRTPRWRRDGRALFYSRPDGIVVSTEVRAGTESFSTGTTTEVLQRHLTATLTEAPYDVFPDGQRFVISSVRKGSMHAPLTLLHGWARNMKP